MRSAISASPASAVATKVQGGGKAAIKFSAYRLLPDRAPPRTSVSWGIVDWVTVARERHCPSPSIKNVSEPLGAGYDTRQCVWKTAPPVIDKRRTAAVK